MKLSIVTTLYHSAPYIEEFYKRIVKTGDKITDDYEIIFVNDGSPDNSLDIAVNLCKNDSKIKIIDLSRNFGHHKAIMTGFQHAKGDYIFLIDSDLEEDPELLIRFYEEMEKYGIIDVVYGYQKKRKGKVFERISGHVFYKILHFFVTKEYPKNTLTARLMKRKYVDAVTKFSEKDYDLWCIFISAGFNQKGIYVDKTCKGSSEYNFTRKVMMLVNTITSSTSKPLFLIFLAGIMISAFSFIYMIYLLINKLLTNVAIGWTSVLASIWLIGGIMMFAIGIVGIYLSKIYIEVKNRPNSITKNIYSNEK
jgi:putative glycosyltransferase